MSRPAVEVADILREQGDRLIEQNPWLNYQQLSVLRAIRRCRTAALGGHIDQCSQCGHQAISYNSCRNRHCPKCQAQARQRWLAAREKELLGVPYFHVVFTLPHELNPLCRYNARILYDLLFRNSAAAMLEVAANPKRLGAQIGFISILHTWGQNLLLHPHIHCLVPAGGFSSDHQRWIHPKCAYFFLPVDALSSVFRAKFVDGLRMAYQQGKLVLPGSIAELDDPKRFTAFIDSLFQKEWVVYAKSAFGGPTQVLGYLGRYTHRVAISHHRLFAFDGESVTFRWKDYAHGNKHRKMTLAASEFLRRFIQHILPRRFVRIRQFGYLTNTRRSARLALARQLLAVAPEPPECSAPSTADTSTYRCPRCDGPMRIGPNLSARRLISQCRSLDSS